MVDIDGERLIASLQELRTFGANGNGVVRPMYSDTDLASRNWLVTQMEAAGLDATIDGVGSVFGRSTNSGPAVVIGSHTDTQPNGGWLDGAMGVMYGVEVARSLAADPATSHLAIDVASWADEEGTYGNFIGSRSFFDEFPDHDFSLANADGETVEQALARLGLADTERAQFEPDRQVAFLEAHIEQGPHLEDEELLLGVVTSIVGIRAMQITFTGQQNHAGTTPMKRRADAGAALFDFGVRARDRLRSLAGPATVWTIGNFGVSPGAESIIPGAAWCGLQFRDADEAILDRFETEITLIASEMSAEGPVSVTAEMRRAAVAPAHMDNGLRTHLSAAAEQRAPHRWTHMPSAAAHDAQIAARHMPTAMLFIPSIDGISHDFAEDSRHQDIILGCQVLADAAVSILAE